MGLNFLKSIKLAYCETIEEKVARYRTAGLNEEEIDKLLLELPSGFKAGQKLFTQDDVTKFRNDERRKVESNFRTKPDPIVEPVVAGQTNPPVVPNPAPVQVVQPVGLSQEEIQNLVKQSIQSALDAQKATYEQEISGLKDSLTNVSNAYTADKQKAFDARKAQILAELPESVHNLVNVQGSDIDALEAQYATVKAFIESTKQEAQTAVTAQVAVQQHAQTVFFKAEDGTEYANVDALVGNIAHLQEWKAKQA